MSERILATGEIPVCRAVRVRSARLGLHTPLEVTRQKQFSIVFAKESLKQGVGRAECIEATGDDYATACSRGARSPSPGEERANSRCRRDSHASI